MRELQWESVPHARHGQVMVDVPGIGRFLVKRLGKGSREWRAYRNGEATDMMAGIDSGGKRGVMRKVQRARRCDQKPASSIRQRCPRE
jgi:hypothetical protein